MLPLTSSFIFYPECSSSAVADVVFLVDGSWSVGRANFKYVRGFLSAAAGAFQVGADRTRVGVVQYGSDPRTEFPLNRHATRPELLRAIGSLPYKGGDTKTGGWCLHLDDWIPPGHTYSINTTYSCYSCLGVNIHFLPFT